MDLQYILEMYVEQLKNVLHTLERGTVVFHELSALGAHLVEELASYPKPITDNRKLW